MPHEWVRTFTNIVTDGDPEKKYSRYQCQKCAAEFRHYYDLEDFLDAKETVSEVCALPLSSSETPKLKVYLK